VNLSEGIFSLSSCSIGSLEVIFLGILRALLCYLLVPSVFVRIIWYYEYRSGPDLLYFLLGVFILCVTKFYLVFLFFFLSCAQGIWCKFSCSLIDWFFDFCLLLISLDSYSISWEFFSTLLFNSSFSRNTVILSHLWIYFHGFHYLWPPWSENVREFWQKQFVSCKLCTALLSAIAVHATLFCPASGMNQPFVQCVHAVYTTFPSAI
jgi:hypothetical protein